MNPTDDKLTPLRAERQALLAALMRAPSGSGWCRRQTEFIDRVVRQVCNEYDAAFPDHPPVSFVACGGYGRSELAPYSDIDLTVIPLQERGADFDAGVRLIYRRLEELLRTELGLEIGYSYQLISDAPGLDPKSRASMLDARLVAGAMEPLKKFQEAFWDSFPVGEFLIAKLEEREAQLKASNATPYVVQPDLKIGAGGLRSYHLASWIGTLTGERETRPSKALEHVLMVRNLLQALAGKPANVLTRSRQAELAELFDQDMFEAMSEVIRSLSEVHEIEQSARQNLLESRFHLTANILSIRGEVRVTGPATLSEAALGVALGTQLGLRVEPIQMAVSPEVEAGTVLYALRFGTDVLLNLDRCSLLRQLLPELDACKTLLPRDSSHMFTVYEHTLEVVREIQAMRSTGFFGEVYDRVRDKGLLILATLLHDAGKADLTGPHSDTGKAMAQRIGERWGMETEASELVQWLVQEHLTLARYVNFRDLQNPDTVREFAEIVGSMERLDMLTVMTAADIKAVGPGVYTPMQEAGIRELYHLTRDLLEEPSDHTVQPALLRQRVLRAVRDSHADADAMKQFVDSLPAHYVFAASPEQVREHFFFAQDAAKGEIKIEFFHNQELHTTEVTVACLDRAGLLSDILGAIYALDLSLVGLRAATTSVSPSIAIDVLTINHGGRCLGSGTSNLLAEALRQVLSKEVSLNDLLKKHGKNPEQIQKILRYDFVEGTPSLIEIRATRGRGMAFRLCQLISRQGWNIQTARVGQWAGHGVAAFYVTAGDGVVLDQGSVKGVLGKE